MTLDQFIFPIVFLILYSGYAYSQQDSSNSISDIYSEIIENTSDDSEEEVSDDFIADKLETLKSNPVDLNTADIFELQQVPLMTADLAEKIIAYRTKAGRIFSSNELLLIDGFDPYLVKVINPFVTAGYLYNGTGISSRFKNNSRHKLSIDFRSRLIYNLQNKRGFEEGKYKGTRPKCYNRIKIRLGKTAGINYLAEKDEGEKKLNDFNSINVWITDFSFVKSLVLGDYFIEAGQGLTLWSSYAAPPGLDIYSPVMRNPRNLKPYTSSGEYRFFRGLAGSVHISNYIITLFYSKNFTDANIDSSDGIITSFRLDGYHRTENEISKKDNSEEISLGFVAEYYVKNFIKAGFIFLNTSLDKPLNLNFRDALNKFNNFSFYYDIFFNSFKITGEAAYDNSYPAIISSFHYFISESINSIFSIRYYSPKFNSLRGLGFGNGTFTGNEIGFYTGLTIRNSLGRFIFNYDIFKHPFPVFNLQLPSCGCKAALTWISPNIFGSQVKVRYNYSRGEINSSINNLSVMTSRSKNKIKLEFRKNINKLRIKSGVAYTWLSPLQDDTEENGFSISQDIKFSPSEYLTIYARMLFFRTESYQSALYEFEDDLQGVFKNCVIFGTGTRWYIIIKIIPLIGINVSVKYSETLKPYLKSMGSGYAIIDGDTDNCIGIQLDYEL